MISNEVIGPGGRIEVSTNDFTTSMPLDSTGDEVEVYTKNKALKDRANLRPWSDFVTYVFRPSKMNAPGFNEDEPNSSVFRQN